MTDNVENIADWQASNWDDLVSILRELLPDVDAIEEDFAPQFRSSSLTPQQAGRVFENWMLEAFRLSEGEVDSPFRVQFSGQVEAQHDGLLYIGWQGFLVESKLLRDKVDFGPIALLHVRCEDRPPNTMGLIIAPSGFTMPAIEEATRMRPLRVLLLTRRDLEWAIIHKSFIDMITEKWRMAVKYARPNYPLGQGERPNA